MPVLDGLPYGLSQSTAVQNGNSRAMAMSTGDLSLNGPMSRSSFASFHLTGQFHFSYLELNWPKIVYRNQKQQTDELFRGSIVRERRRGLSL